METELQSKDKESSSTKEQNINKNEKRKKINAMLPTTYMVEKPHKEGHEL